MEVDLETGFLEAINLAVAEWSYTQELDYEQIPFKCRFCHGYGHFARNCKKKGEEDNANEKMSSRILFRKQEIPTQDPKRSSKKAK